MRGFRRRAAWLLVALAAGALLAIGVGSRAIPLLAPPDPAPALAAPRFVEEAASAGIDHVYDGDFEFFVGGGVAAFDCNDDGRPELYFAGGSRPAALFRNASPTGRALSFARVGDAATDLISVTGAYPLDVDGDGRTDLAVLRFGETVFLRGLGDCRFERANEAWSIRTPEAWTVGFSATWEGAATRPTMALGNYLGLEPDGQPGDTCDDDALIRPSPAGVTYQPALPLSPSWCSLSILFSDWDRSGRRDLRVSNDRHYYRDGEEQLWRMGAGEPPRLYTAADGWQTVRVWGMGIASQDLTGDGYPEVYLTSQGDNKLQQLVDGPSRPQYRNIALERNATAHRPYAGDVTMPSTAWHAEFQDVNNDGYMDLFVAKGNVEAMTEYAAKDPSNLLIGQADGTFREGAGEAGIVSFARARGAALVDLNLDGLLDLVEVNRREPVGLWRNVGAGDASGSGAMGHWLALTLEQDRPNRDAIGAWIEVRTGERTMRREVTVGGGHAGGQLGWLHVGLGSAPGADVRVQWPDGEWGPWQRAGADGFIVLRRGAEPEAWRPVG